jgi:uncharacterized protein YvpB
MADPIFWQKFYELGKKAGAKFPELVAAQAALESGWGKHISGKNNYFGIKGSPGTIKTTQEWNGSRMVTIEDEFKDFDTPLDSVKHLVSRWYEDYRGYRGVNRASTAQEAAMLLKEEGYATDPVYPELLVNLMMDNHEVEEKDDYFLPRAAVYYTAQPHQEEAWRMLEDNLEPELLEAFKAAYRGSQANEKEVVQKFPLDVPYYNQHDSATSQGFRMCFSSAMAMALDYVSPEKFEGMDDDDYLRVVLKYGDTVSSDAQVAAAEALGFDVEFRTDGNVKDLEELLDEGTPVPVGILHHGSADHPSGGGHWVTLIGHDDTHFWVHDPAGDLDLIRGGYHSWDSGERLRYSKENLLKRWNIVGDSDGWFVKIR